MYGPVRVHPSTPQKDERHSKGDKLGRPEATSSGGSDVEEAKPWAVAVSPDSQVHLLYAESTLTKSIDTGSETADDEEPAGPNWAKIALKIAFSVLGFLLLVCLLEHLCADQVEHASHKLIEHIGLPGLFIGVLLADGLPQPFTYVPLIYMSVEGGVPKWRVFAICMTASYVAALLGYCIGSYISRRQWGEQWFGTLREKYPDGPDLMERRGAIGVLLAAMLPVPLAAATWTAGFLRVNMWHFLVAALGRCPKIAIFVALSPCPGHS